MTPIDAQVLGSILTFAAAVGVVYLQNRKISKVAKETTGAQLVEEALGQMRETIAGQGRTIEQHTREIGELKLQLAARDRVVRAAGMFIDRIGLWLAGGQTGAQPQPSKILHEHIDPTLWEQPPEANDLSSSGPDFR